MRYRRERSLGRRTAAHVRSRGQDSRRHPGRQIHQDQQGRFHSRGWPRVAALTALSLPTRVSQLHQTHKERCRTVDNTARHLMVVHGNINNNYGNNANHSFSTTTLLYLVWNGLIMT